MHIIAINGTITDTPSKPRYAGLHKAIQEDGNSNLLRSVYGYWLKKNAYYKAFHLAKRTPSARVYRAANDLMAVGIEQALSEHGLIQGKDYITGGVDWTKEGLTAIQENKITALSVGILWMQHGR